MRAWTPLGGKKGHEDAVRRVFRAVAEHHRLHRFPLAVRGAVDPEVKRAAGDGSVGSKAEQGLGAPVAQKGGRAYAGPEHLARNGRQ